MPELPEVETMVRGLRPVLEGQTIRSLAVRDPFLLQGCSAEEIERRVAGAPVQGVGRRGKWIVLTLGDSVGMIVIQPRMTGGFWLVPPDRPEHVRLILQVGQPERTIWYCDTRRLGKVAWYPEPEAAEAAFRRSHGPDALEIDRAELAERLRRTGRAIKPTLMDQKVLAGLGNIYTDEVLFRAGLHPERPASDLSDEEIGRLHEAIGSVLAEAITAEGSSFDRGYRTVLGLEGGFLTQNAVHRRAGQPCPRCGKPIVKTKIAGLVGRPTYLCPTCQPAPGSRPPRGPSGRRGRDRVS
ncbi:MAG: DNA-formamidopyrimidine glycosylase [Isosphaeraceae bacterium]|nr:DNA-formamidopyrimidine glycosylase [Isosphaeraceae bacterium]